MTRKTTWLPDQPLPQYADKQTAAAIITHFYFPISPRTLERWPLIVRRPNKVAIYAVEELLSVAKQKFDDACAYKQEVC